MRFLRYRFLSPDESGSTPSDTAGLEPAPSIDDVPMGLGSLLGGFTGGSTEAPKDEPKGSTPASQPETPKTKTKTPATPPQDQTPTNQGTEPVTSTSDTGAGNDAGDDEGEGDTVFGMILADSGMSEEEITEAGLEIPEEESVENVTAFVGKLTQHLRATAPQRVFQQLEERLPDVADYLEFRMNGGKPEEYYALLSGGDISQLDLTQETTQRQIVTRYLTEVSKYTPEEASEEVTSLVDSGRLEVKATQFHKKLSEHQESRKEELLATQAEKANQIKQAETQLWNNIQKTVLTDGKIAVGQHEVVIPEVKRNEFYRFIKERGKDGKTAAQTYYAQMDTQTRLMFDWLAFNKVDLGALGTRVAATQKVGQKSRQLSGGSRMGGTGNTGGARAATGKTAHIPLTGETFGSFINGE